VVLLSSHGSFVRNYVSQAWNPLNLSLISLCCETLAHCVWSVHVRRVYRSASPPSLPRLNSIFSWEFFTTLDYEWSVIRRHRPYRWTIWVCTETQCFYVSFLPTNFFFARYSCTPLHAWQPLCLRSLSCLALIPPSRLTVR